MTLQGDRAQNCGGGTTVLGDLQSSSPIWSLGIVSSLQQGRQHLGTSTAYDPVDEGMLLQADCS